jgi:hypothetical protein
LEEKEYRFLELKHAILSARIKFGLWSKQPGKPIMRVDEFLGYFGGYSECDNKIDMLRTATRVIAPLVNEMHALQKDVDAILSDFEVERMIRENQALERQLSRYKSKWDVEEDNEDAFETLSEFKTAKKL